MDDFLPNTQTNTDTRKYPPPPAGTCTQPFGTHPQRPPPPRISDRPEEGGFAAEHDPAAPAVPLPSPQTPQSTPFPLLPHRPPGPQTVQEEAAALHALDTALKAELSVLIKDLNGCGLDAEVQAALHGARDRYPGYAAELADALTLVAHQPGRPAKPLELPAVLRVHLPPPGPLALDAPPVKTAPPRPLSAAALDPPPAPFTPSDGAAADTAPVMTPKWKTSILTSGRSPTSAATTRSLVLGSPSTALRRLTPLAALEMF